jgi:hypothetical protein
MKYTVITAVCAALTLGGGLALGADHDPAPTRAPAVSSHTLCEQLRAEILHDHPDAYVGDCNEGTNTLP